MSSFFVLLDLQNETILWNPKNYNPYFKGPKSFQQKQPVSLSTIEVSDKKRTSSIILNRTTSLHSKKQEKMMNTNHVMKILKCNIF